MRGARRFTDDESARIIKMWNARKTCQEIAAALECTTRQVYDRVKYLRGTAKNIELRGNDKRQTGRPPVYFESRKERMAREMARRAELEFSAKEKAEAAKLAQTRFPDWVRFQDDPRAVVDRGSAFMPRKPDIYYSASSLAGSSRLISSSGKNGAVA